MDGASVLDNLSRTAPIVFNITFVLLPLVISATVLYCHLVRQAYFTLLSAVAACPLLIADLMAIPYLAKTLTPLTYVAGQVLSISILTFVILCELLQRGVASALIRWRGEQWVKELDYIYLLVGSVGVLLALNRLENVTGKANVPGLIGPLIIATAIVVRLIKTRAEIGEWNKVATWTKSPSSLRPGSS